MNYESESLWILILNSGLNLNKIAYKICKEKEKNGGKISLGFYNNIIYKIIEQHFFNMIINNMINKIIEESINEYIKKNEKFEKKTEKDQIEDIFNKNVKGRFFQTSGSNKHCGKNGHMLENAMGLTINSHNAPDILGWEMKDQTKSKITFGDWGPQFKLFNENDFFNGKNKKEKRKLFFKIFGKPNPKKHNRLSYTRPKYNKIIDGKKMIESETDILVVYNFYEDTRKNKNELVPKKYRSKKIILEKWEKLKLKEKLENKFYQNGWFCCRKDKNGIYTHIDFFNPISFDKFIELIRKNMIYQDGVPYQSNNRWYSSWRINNNNIKELYK